MAGTRPTPLSHSRVVNTLLNIAQSSYYKVTLVVPEAVKNATLEYKSESDTLGAFINEKCIENPEIKIHTTKLFQLFKDWAKENNEPGQVRSNRALIGLLRDREFQVLPGSQNKHFVHGLGAEAVEAETWVN